MNLRDTIYREITLTYRYIPKHIARSVSNRLSTTIPIRESSGEIISKELLNDELIPAFIKSYIRHKETGYDMLLRSGVPRDVARKQLSNYINEKYKWITRR